MFGTIKIDDVYETEVTSLENEGKGVCKIHGMICFVPKALPGEKVKVRITEKKKNFLRGKLIEVLNPSDKRVEPKCPYYDLCGGCMLRHQDSEENTKFKKEKVETALKKIGKLDVEVSDVITSLKDNNYRNKVGFKVEDDKIGFYEEGTYRLINIKECLLCKNEINNALKVIKRYLEFNINQIKNITIRHSNSLGELLIDIESNDDYDIKIADYLKLNVSKIRTIIFNDEIVHGDGYIKEVTNGLMFNVSAKSFFQVNSNMVEKLYGTAIKLAKLKNSDVALDLYCGTGTITSIIAGHTKKVIGIEIIDDAIKDAKENIKLNHINNVSFICGDVTKEITKIKEDIDVIFVDPPRKGIDRKAIAIMKKINPKKIIYISCNPVTMARDLSYLNDLYEIKKVVPVDMFPNTSHVECITLLELKK